MAARPGRRPAVALLLVPVVTLAVLGVRDARRHDREREARTAAGLGWTVVRAVPSARARGVSRSPVQQGIVDLLLRNDSDSEVEIVDVALDGSGPVSPGPGRVGAHDAVELPVAWRVRCAEVGNQPGPRLVDLRVRLRSATSYAVQVPLTGKLTDQPFHEAIVAACDVLVAP